METKIKNDEMYIEVEARLRLSFEAVTEELIWTIFESKSPWKKQEIEALTDAARERYRLLKNLIFMKTAKEFDCRWNMQIILDPF